MREALEEDRVLRVKKNRMGQTEARKRGHLQPLATKTMKRRLGNIVPARVFPSKARRDGIAYNLPRVQAKAKDGIGRDPFSQALPTFL